MANRVYVAMGEYGYGTGPCLVRESRENGYKW